MYLSGLADDERSDPLLTRPALLATARFTHCRLTVPVQNVKGKALYPHRPLLGLVTASVLLGPKGCSQRAIEAWHCEATMGENGLRCKNAWACEQRVVSARHAASHLSVHE